MLDIYRRRCATDSPANSVNRHWQWKTADRRILSLVCKRLTAAVICCAVRLKGTTTTSNTTRWQLFVGGRPHQLSDLPSTSMSGFVGCLSRLYVNDLKLQLAKAVAADLPGPDLCCSSWNDHTKWRPRTTLLYTPLRSPSTQKTKHSCPLL